MNINPYYLSRDFLYKKKNSTRRIVLILINLIEHPDPCEYIRLINAFSQKRIQNEYEVKFGDIDQIINFRPDICIYSRVPKFSLEKIQESVRFLRSYDAKIIYEIDDNLIELDKAHPEFDYYQTQIEKKKYLLKNSDTVIASTENLSTQLQFFSSNIVVCKNVRRINPTYHGHEDFNPTKKLIYIASNTHLPDLKTLLDAVQRLNTEGVLVNLYLIGLEYVDSQQPWIHNIPIPKNVDNYPEFMRWTKIFFNMDYGLAPLISNNFNQAKSAIKLLDYLEIGLPTIASNIGEFGEIIIDGKNGYLVRESWYKKLKEVLTGSLGVQKKQLVDNALRINNNYYEEYDAQGIRLGILRSLSH